VRNILPRVDAHGRVYFRHVRCKHRREELLAEMAALTWKWFIRLVQRGKDVLRFAGRLAVYAARAIGGGRRVCGRERARDAMTPSAQHRHSFAVGSLPEVGPRLGASLAEALQDNTTSPVPDQVIFRVDFPAWRHTRSERDQRIIDALMIGESTAALARRFGVSAPRISQLRREFCADWHAYCAERAPQVC
jgi:hypothetical protein